MSPHTCFPCDRSEQRRRKKVTKERATLQAASLRFAAGNLRCSRPPGSRSNSLRFTSLKQSRALIRWPLRSSAHPEGNPGCGHPHGPLLRSAPSRGRERHALRRRGRAKQWPVGLFGCWMFGCPPPAGCACGGAVAGWHARRSARASCSDSPWLSERRAQRKASSTVHPATAPTQVCPTAKRRGRRLGVAFSLVTFFWRSKRKSLACRATPGLRPPKRHAAKSAHALKHCKINSYQRISH